MLKNVDKCMTNVEDTDCTASYGVSANLVSSGGKSIVGYVKQLSKYLIMTGEGMEGLIRLGKSLAQRLYIPKRTKKLFIFQNTRLSSIDETLARRILTQTVRLSSQ